MLDSIVRKDYNSYTEKWEYYGKHIYIYSENAFEVIELRWVYELNAFIETHKSESLLDFGKIYKRIYYHKENEKWLYSSHIEFEYNSDEYSVIQVESYGTRSKQTYKYSNSDSMNESVYLRWIRDYPWLYMYIPEKDLVAESLYFWSSAGGGYWSLDSKREYTYFLEVIQMLIQCIILEMN